MDASVLKSVLFEHNPRRDIILKALDEIKNYVPTKNLIITGGTAIDMALRLKGGSIYDDKQMPDYDFVSPNYYANAYEIAKILSDKGFPLVSVIPTFHYGTVAIRTDFMAIADISYMPPAQFDSLKTLNWSGMKIIHPHYQIFDQHYSLSHPYENPPIETIFHRWTKDMKRFDIIWKYYPITDEKLDAKTPLDWEADSLLDECLCGNEALVFWLYQAKKMGFQTKIGTSWDITKNKIKCSCDSPMPFDGVHAYSDYFEQYANDSTHYFAPFLDRLPRHIETQNKGYKLVIYDNYGARISAHAFMIDQSIQWLVSIQLIMMLLMQKYLYHHDHIATHWYLVMLEIVKWATEDSKKRAMFLPGAETYGTVTWSGAQQICVLNTFGTPEQKAKVRRPPIIHAEVTMPDQHPYSVDGSLLGSLDGKEISKFAPHKVNVS